MTNAEMLARLAPRYARAMRIRDYVALVAAFAHTPEERQEALQRLREALVAELDPPGRPVRYVPPVSDGLRSNGGGR